MRILYDHQAYTIQEYGGISRYFYELTHQLRIGSNIEILNSLFLSNNVYIKENGAIKSTPFLKGIKFWKKTQIMLWINELKSSVAFNDDKFDIFHPTYYDTYYLKLKSKKPIVITFHDLIHEKFMQYDLQTLANKKRVLNRADAIITISQNSKNDLMEYYRIPEKRINVISLASSFFSNENTEKIIKDNYILYVGGRNQYKNFNFFVKSIASLLLKSPDLNLYCAGGGSFTKEENILLHELRISKKVKQYSVSDDGLKQFYSGALAFLFPSIYEGFGIPLLEAMNCGCPIGASHTSSLSEVAGDAAFYFDPYDHNSILSATETLVNNQGIQSTLKRNGYKRAKEFSWAKTAELTARVYQGLLSKPILSDGL